MLDSDRTLDIDYRYWLYGGKNGWTQGRTGNRKFEMWGWMLCRMLSTS